MILAHLVEQKFLGTLGSGFNSHKLQQLSSSKISLIFIFYRLLAQLVRAPLLYSEGYGFDAHTAYNIFFGSLSGI